MIKKALESIRRRDFPLNERIFRMIVLVGTILAMIGLLECLVVTQVRLVMIPILILLFVFIFSLVMTFQFRRIDIASIVLGIFLPAVVFPDMFIMSGGLQGGATVWFVVCIIYSFLMFDGMKLKIFLCLDVLMDVIIYLFGYYYPDKIIPMGSTKDAYADSFFAVVVIGFSVGTILKLQKQIFNQERDVTLEQKEALKQVSDSKSDFFASMSHEIRTPINTIIGLNEVILRETKEKDTKEYSQNIQRASKMLLSLVNDILDLSQMEMKKMEIVPDEYKTADLFFEIIDMMQVRLKEKNLDFMIDIDENLPSVLYGDMKRIQQVLLNILTNAAKYTQEGSVTLTAGMEWFGDGEILLKVSVEDTGIGIRKEDLNTLYESFRRVDETNTRSIEGSGLGLSITKQLVDLMQGQITVDSIYTKGSTFSVSIPQQIVEKAAMGDIRAYAAMNAAGSAYECLFEAPEARILVVDDNDLNSMVVCKLLKDTRVQVDVAKSGTECLEMTNNKYYHIILMDYMMPEMDGGEVLKAVRHQENGLCRDSIVIVLTAYSLVEANKLYRDHGFDSFLEKPVRGMALEEQLLHFLPEDIIEYKREQKTSLVMEDIQNVIRKRKRRVIVTTDCVSDIPNELREKYGIDQIYTYIKLNEARFADTLEIDSDDMMNYLDSSDVQIQVDSMSIEEYEAFYAEALTKGEEVLHITLSELCGKSYGTAVEAAKGFDHVHVLDSGFISCAEGMVVLYAARLAYDGESVSSICEKLQVLKKKIMFRTLLPSMNRMVANGRMEERKARLPDAMGIHPVMMLKKRGIGIAGMMFGSMEAAYRKFIWLCLRNKRRIDPSVIYITHAGMTERQLDMIRREVMRYAPFEQVIMQQASVSITCNGGIGTVGLAYQRKGGMIQ